MEFSRQAINDIASLTGRINEEYAKFIEKCKQHRPRVWKDPRLWLTVQFWKDFLDLDHCRFILLTRSIMPSWISQILRHKIISDQYSKTYETRIQQSILKFFEQNRVSYLHVYLHVGLILRPADTIKELKNFSERIDVCRTDREASRLRAPTRARV